MIFVRKDSGIKTAADMKGKVFAFVDKATTAGHLLPLAYFQENGIKDYKTYLQEFYFAGTHEDTIYDVLNKKADIGAAKNTVYYHFAESDKRINDELVILKRSPDVPQNGLVLRNGLDKTIMQKIKNTLLNMHRDPDGKMVLKHFKAKRFIETADKDYAAVYKYIHEIGLKLKSYIRLCQRIMKKKIIISAIVFTLIFLLCFLYIIFTIEQGTTKLDNLITLHQVEILREHLLLQVKKVQSDLQVKNTRYARTIETVINNVRTMESMANTCFDCHHPEEMVHEFYNLQNDILSYKNAISRLLTVRANVRRLEIEEVKAYKLGEHLLEMVNDMISIASSKLESKTQQELKNIADTKFILFILLAFGPLSIMVTSILVIKGITNPLNILLDATKKIRCSS
jgi:hypothetical protein